VKTPRPPLLVLAVSLVLPGMGQVLNEQPRRGLLMVLYMLLLGVLTYTVASPDTSVVGRCAGGVFVYAMSVMDAYRVAATRRAVVRQRRSGAAGGLTSGGPRLAVPGE
jgi:TM2 domain-containing membrane protein YozV